MQYRYLVTSVGAPESTYAFHHDDAGDAGRTIRYWTVIGDPSGTYKAWVFRLDPGPYLGLWTWYEDRSGYTGPPLRHLDAGYAQDYAGAPYLSSVTTTLSDTGQQTRTEQTLSWHGNLTRTRIYDYGNLRYLAVHLEPAGIGPR